MLEIYLPIKMQVSSVEVSVYDSRTSSAAEQQTPSNNFGRGGSPPTSTSSSTSSSSPSTSSSSLSSTSTSSSSVPSFHSEQQILHPPESSCQDQSHMIAKQETVDYFYSNCNNPCPPLTAMTTSMNFMEHGNDGNTFPSFYSLINANNSGRRADEMLSGHGYR